jgi:3-oxoacyl-[acyl-carrier protein] reductase
LPDADVDGTFVRNLHDSSGVFVGTLTGRVALVTGASRGIGKAIALGLAGAGADVAVNYQKQAAQAQEVCDEITKTGARAIPLQADVSYAAEVDRMVTEVEAKFGPVDILVNNAGIAQQVTLDQITEADWDELIRVNLKSVFLVTQRVLPGMRSKKWGRIINLSSVAAQIGGVVGLHYTASKAGIVGMTRYYALHLAKQGITSNVISPGPIDTDMVRGINIAPERIPVGFIGGADEPARVAVMLAESAYITGQTISVNGGMYMS